MKSSILVFGFISTLLVANTFSIAQDNKPKTSKYSQASRKNISKKTFKSPPSDQYSKSLNKDTITPKNQ